MELFKTGQYVDMVLSYLRAEDLSSDLLLKEYSSDETRAAGGPQIFGHVYPQEDPTGIRAL